MSEPKSEREVFAGGLMLALGRRAADRAAARRQRFVAALDAQYRTAVADAQRVGGGPAGHGDSDVPDETLPRLEVARIVLDGIDALLGEISIRSCGLFLSVPQ
jgi:hypothetical protein